MMKDKGITLEALSKSTGIARSTLRGAKTGNTVGINTADAIANALAHKTSALFNISQDLTPLKEKTVLEHHRLISTILAQAEKEMLIPYNPASKASPPRASRDEPSSLQPEEIEKIWSYLDNEPIKWKTIVHLLIITGCRRGEIAGLKWSDIDWDKKVLHIKRALLYSRDIGIYETTTKTGDDRYISIPDDTILALKEYYAYYLGLRLKNGDRWVQTDYVFCKDNGSEMNPDTITSWLASFGKKNGFSNLHPHQFRHTSASIMIANGVDVVTVSKRLGHRNTTTTTNIYSHLIKKADEQAGECIANFVMRKHA